MSDVQDMTKDERDHCDDEYFYNEYKEACKVADEHIKKGFPYSNHPYPF